MRLSTVPATATLPRWANRPGPVFVHRPARVSSTARWLAFLVLQAPLAMIMKANPVFATLHALIVFVTGLAAVRHRTPEKVIIVMGYIIASEPLWRASKAMIFHESAKYAIAGLALLSMVRFRLQRRIDKTALVYFLFLLPSLLVIPEFDRERISFNLSGPFALATTTLFMSALKISPRTLGRIFLATLAPILGLAFVATFSTLTTESIDFYSSKVASGGLGKNQASSILCLGGLLAFLYICIEQKNRPVRWFVAAAGIWCTAQGALTFSRGGVATTLGAVAAASFFLLQDRRLRFVVVLRVLLVTALAAYLIVPVIDTFTGGAFTSRFSSTHLTGRDKIIEADFIAFRENPLFGVGPGQSREYHALTFKRTAAHTEYSRLLAEHGSFGLLALALLAWMSFRRLLRRAPPRAKAVSASLTVWTLLFMFHAAMRMAAASFTFALGAAFLLAADKPPARALIRVRQTNRTASVS